MKLGDFHFELPERLIAQHPLPERDGSRMMVVWRETGRREHHSFRELPAILDPHSFLVMNSTRVFPARLRARRPGKREEIEILLVREQAPGEWQALLKPARKAPAGQELLLEGMRAHVAGETDSGGRILRFKPAERVMEMVERTGEPPLPPYIHRVNKDFTEDRTRYQTVYARHTGSVAAPTAGLHFSVESLNQLSSAGIGRCEILLHIGYGTFQPVRCEEVENHHMEPEYYEVSQASAGCIRAFKDEGRKLIAVGSTTTRVLEHLAASGGPFDRKESGLCNLFIYPGFRFRLVDALLTNFHLPRSTLFMLVSAFAGREMMLDCYREAVMENYRFFSYGDCMLIL